MFNIARVRYHQDTRVNATNATLNRENTKPLHLSDAFRRETKNNEVNMVSRIIRESNVPSLEVVLFRHLDSINENGRYSDDENYCQESGKRTC